ncbi:MAG: histidine phosphatase family protein [Desulfobacteraceae bacterium]|nr:histidine phosphatase family protein [Desulfobacteraceae bacterium]
MSLIRHAKSSWDFEGLDDLDRPLNPRGREDAAKMGRILSESGFAPQRLLCSPALRAIRTALVMAEAVGFPSHQIEMTQKLYHNRIDGMLALLRANADEVRWVACVGHNPELTALVHRLGAKEVEDMPTCAVVELHFAIDRWKELGQGDPVRVRFKAPKNHP